MSSSKPSLNISYSEGAKPGKKRKPEPPGPSQKHPDKRSYDEKRSERPFNPKWLDEIPWLRYDPESGMTCTLCIEHSSSSSSSKLKSDQQAFRTGCKNYRKSAVHTHNSSIPHKNAVTTDNDLKNPADAPAVKSVLSLNEKQRKDMEIKFLNACQTPATVLRFCLAE